MLENLPQDQLICLAGAAVGLAVLAFGFWRRHEANHLKAFPLTPVAQARYGSPAAVSGIIQATAVMNSPVKGTPCVFYRLLTEHQVEERYKDKHDGQYKNRWVWKTVGESIDGGFFVGDGSGTALVVPTRRCLDLDGGAETQTDSSIFGGGTRRTEWILVPGRAACATGTPQGPEAFIAAATGDPTLAVSPAVIARLRELVASAQPVPCYYLDALDTVLDRPYEDAVKSYEDSARVFIQYGGIGAGAGLLFLAMLHFHVF